MSISLLERPSAAGAETRPEARLDTRPSVVWTHHAAHPTAWGTVIVLGRSPQARNVAGWLGAAGYDVRDRIDTRGGEGAAALVVELADAAETAPSQGNEAVIALVADSRRSELARLSAYDDFILPSVTADEVVLRVQRAVAHRRRHRTNDSGDVLEVGDVRIDAGRYRAWIAGEAVELTHKEFELLLYVARRPGRVVTREELLRHVWGFEVFVGARTVDVHVRRLRQKINDSKHGLIETVRRVGYRLREAPAQAEAGIA